MFCGCGGLSHGFENAGFDVLLGIDFWKDALVTYKYNHKNSETLCAELSQMEASTVEKKIGGKKVDVIIGGSPCQGLIKIQWRNDIYHQ